MHASTSQPPPERRERARTRDRLRIAVLVDWLGNDYIDPILDEVVAGAYEHGLELVCLVGELPFDESEVFSRNLAANLAGPALVDGVLVISLGARAPVEQISRYCERYRPLPICSVTVPLTRHPHVVVDDTVGLRAGIEHLVRVHGYRKIAFIRGPAVSNEAELRFAVYREVLNAHGIAYDPALVTEGFYVELSGIQAVRTLLDERKVVFEAIVSANDGMAYGALEELKYRGIRVPEEVAILGFDDLEHSRYVRPPLSSVRQPLRQHGRTALELLVAQMAGNEVPLETKLGTELVLRRSCGCLPYAARSESASSLPPAGAASLPRLQPAQLDVRLGRTGTIVERVPDAVRRLSQAFVTDVTDGRDSLFLPALEALIESLAAVGGGLQEAHCLLADLRRQARRQLEMGSESWRRADGVLNVASNLVGEIAESVQVSRRVQANRSLMQLNRTNEALLAAVDLPLLENALARELPGYRVEAFYLCLFETDRAPAESARLVLGLDQNGPLRLPPGGVRFPCRTLLPPGILPEPWQSSYIVYSLLGSELGEPDGYLVFAGIPKDGPVYDALVNQIGSAYKRIRLIEHSVEQAQRREVAERERLEKEMHIASQIQTGVLPRIVDVPGLEIATLMSPASEVGGDYYDVIPVPGGCWLAIGDVSGHGLPAGLVMLMLQSVTGGLVRSNPTASPAALMPFINATLFDNIRQRMGQDEHVTLTLLRYDCNGHVAFSGAHELILVYRARTGQVEEVETPGTWVGVVRDISHAVFENSVDLEPGDVLVLHSDGVTEARNPAGELYGLERFQAALRRSCTGPVDQTRDTIAAEVKEWMAVQEDDITLVIVKHRGLS